MEQIPARDAFQRLVELVETLRGPEGCPWDREQTPETLKPMLIEEAHEVLEALDGDDPEQLCEELGDLLFQVLFHSQIAKEQGHFDVHEVCRRLYLKMVRRHPHVFGEARFSDSRELLKHWEEIKKQEKKAAGRPHSRRSMLDGIPASLSSLYQAYQMTSKASRVGFDWPRLEDLKEQLLEEFRELEQALQSEDLDSIREEVGDLLFTALNVARFLQIDPETALGRANRKFNQRFRQMEEHFRQGGRSLKEVSLEEMERFWQSQKQDRSGPNRGG